MADKKEHHSAGGALGGTAIKPEGWDRTGFEAFRYFIYDPKTGAILSRTPMSWAKITGFYLVYYSLLALFWIICLNIFFMTIPKNEPKWTLDKSIIGSNPGVGYRPAPPFKNIDSAMFMLYSQDTNETASTPDGEGTRNADYLKRTELMVKNIYNNHSGLVDCGEVNDLNRGRCRFDFATNLGDCGVKPYGFMPTEDKKLNPCIFIKLNKIRGWMPGNITKDANWKEKYPDMPAHIQTLVENDPENVYIDCKGRYPADREGMDIEYFPKNQALPFKYFPFQGGNYQSPMVAIKVFPKMKAQLLHIECKAWYKDVIHDAKDKMALTNIEVVVR